MRSYFEDLVSVGNVCFRPKADSLTGTGLVSQRLESIYETRAIRCPGIVDHYSWPRYSNCSRVLISDRSSNHERAIAAVDAIEWRNTSAEIGMIKALTLK
jgi:hypothetical protein